VFEAPGVPDVQRAVGDKYQVDSLCGQGGMGAVFLGRNRALGSPVAIKVLPLAGDETESGLARFKREARLAANLSHPNIVAVFDFDIRSGLAYLVMPFVTGETLAQAIERRGRFDLSEVRGFLEQVGKAIAFAHAQGVVHRDIKPANLIREEATGRWLVTDFGIAHLTRPDDGDRTETGFAIGTPAYMAPEQWVSARDVDGRADLYALARVACEMLVGRQGDLPLNQRDVGPALLAADPDLDPGVVEALVAPLANDRDARPSTVDTWLAMLGGGPSPRRVLRTALLGALSLVGVAMVLVAVWTPHPFPTEPPRQLVIVAPFASDTAQASRELAAFVEQELQQQLNEALQAVVVGQSTLRSAGPDPLQGSQFDTSWVSGGSVALLSPDSIQIQLTLLHGSQRAGALYQRAGVMDSVAFVVWELVREAFSLDPSGEPPSLPVGGENFRAYYEGVRLFRRAAYGEAIAKFDEVIARQPTFALAYFKRMLAEVMRVQPTRAGDAVRSALGAAQRYESGLDPASRELLRGYEILITHGDIPLALESFDAVQREHPDFVDAPFVSGFLKLQFASLLGIQRGQASRDLERAYKLLPTFAPVVARLAHLNVLEGNDEKGRTYLREYLTLDSVSVSAQVARVVDSLLYRGSGAQIAVLRSLEHRNFTVLEYLALAAGELRQKAAHREFALNGVEAIGRVAATPHERLVALRMAVSTELALGRPATVDTLLKAAQWNKDVVAERARWQLLAAVTGVANLADTANLETAAGLLTQSPVDSTGTNAWLVARWAYDRDKSLATRARAALQALPPSPVTASLLDDLAAIDHLEESDTSGALTAWQRGLSRYSVEHVVFGLVGSLWPLRLDAARVAAVRGDGQAVLELTTAFEQMAGFVDQVAWPEALLLRVRALRATGNPARMREAQELSTLVGNLLARANGHRVALRDSLRQAYDADTGRARPTPN